MSDAAGDELRQTRQMLDQLEHELSEWRGYARDATGQEGASAAALRSWVEEVRQGCDRSSVHRDQFAALVLDCLEVMREIPTNSMNSGLEMVHHALVASPRTSEQEAQARVYLRMRATALNQRERDEWAALMAQSTRAVEDYHERLRISDEALGTAKSTISDQNEALRSARRLQFWSSVAAAGIAAVLALLAEHAIWAPVLPS